MIILASVDVWARPDVDGRYAISEQSGRLVVETTATSVRIGVQVGDARDEATLYLSPVTAGLLAGMLVSAAESVT